MKSYEEIASDFMEKLKVGDSFKLNDKSYFVKCTGKWKADEYFENKQFKTLTIKCNEEDNLIKFFYFFGYEGNPRSKGRNASVKQHKFVRDLEGALIVDLLNQKNPLHINSEVYRMATT